MWPPVGITDKWPLTIQRLERMGRPRVRIDSSKDGCDARVVSTNLRPALRDLAGRLMLAVTIIMTLAIGIGTLEVPGPEPANGEIESGLSKDVPMGRVVGQDPRSDLDRRRHSRICEVDGTPRV